MTFQNQISSIFDLKKLESCGNVQQVCFQVEMDSTNDVGLELLKQPQLALPALVLCESQRAGRGRGRNAWESDAGALTFSLLLKPGDPPSLPMTLLSLAAGLSIQQSIKAIAPNVDCKIKWPNDVLIGDGKVAGVLIESNANGIVVGIGINVKNELQAGSATNLKSAAIDKLDLQNILMLQLNNFFKTMDRMQAEPAQVIRSCQSEMAWLGEQIELTAGSCQVCGKFVGLESCGSLILQTESETKAIVSATDVRRAKAK